MNFFYLDDEEKIILGTTSTENIEDVIYSVPRGKEFYLYNEGDDLQKILENRCSSGIGCAIPIN